MESLRTVQQVRLPDIVRDALRKLSERDGVNLADIYDDALEWFLKREARKKTIFYLASSHQGGYVTMWLNTKLLDRARAIAQRDTVSLNRVTYTALVLYLQSRKMV